MRYDRNTAVAYAREHAERTDDYRSAADADATAFVSRCVAAGFNLDAVDLELCMTPCDCADILPGDIVQIRTRAGLPYKSLIVTGKDEDGVLVAAHSYISRDRPLKSYKMHEIRCFHLPGA
jgi:hypothetical protein